MLDVWKDPKHEQASQSGVGPHINCYKAEFSLIGELNLYILTEKKSLSWKCVELFLQDMVLWAVENSI